MRAPRYPFRFSTVLCAAAASTLILSGCGPLTATRVEAPKVDARSAATAAIQAYDKDSDGKLNESELSACPAIRNARARYDLDGDKSISEDEIAQHLEQVYAAGVGLLEVKCTVTRGGRPLPGATVRFVPEPFLGEAVQTAVGTTDPSGLVSPSVPPEQLPDNLRSTQLMQAGLYRVEIEHPSLPAGDKKPLGFEVDPTSRDGASARFNL